jgi:transposase
MRTYENTENDYNAELTPEEIQEIQNLREQGLSYRSISKRTGRSLSVIYKYCKDIKPSILEERDVLDFVEPKLRKLEKLEQRADRLEETLKDLVELVFINFQGICKTLELPYNEDKADLLKNQLLKNLNNED